MSAPRAEFTKHSRYYQILLAVSALGVVYGDIGTSPLYALKESFHHTHNILISLSIVYGILSLIFWSLIIVISVKYLKFVLKADNKGEGGILALTALITPVQEKMTPGRNKLILCGLFGTALLYGDGMITPAISVLSAVEGLELITPVFTPYIIPITIAILISLFSVQKYGTGLIGKFFGPITLFWFIVIGIIGLNSIMTSPTVLFALNPYYGIQFFVENGWKGLLVLGSVFLVVTGGEALYSDLGHFGKKPIQYAWMFVALPCLVLNYFGQGAYIISNPEGIKNPFFLMAPHWALTPLVILATVATVIASQALITGVFSITMHAVHLGYIPRVFIKHTSTKEYGQIFVKSMNTVLMFACIGLVLFFKNSSNLAAAYGIAVTMTMSITTLLFFVVAREKWKWSLLKASCLCGFFMIIDIAFLGANIVKIFAGGWVPLFVAILIFIIMTTWSRGRKLLHLRNSKIMVSFEKYIEMLDTLKPHHTSGTAVYMASTMTHVPFALINSLEHFKTIHEHIIFLSVSTDEIPHILKSKRTVVKSMGHGCSFVNIHYGYMDSINVPSELEGIKIDSISIDPNTVSYFLGKENLFATNIPGMSLWRERLFAFQSANSEDATTYFKLPKNRVMEIGIQVDL